jgi:hypothetical protein
LAADKTIISCLKSVRDPLQRGSARKTGHSKIRTLAGTRNLASSIYIINTRTYEKSYIAPGGNIVFFSVVHKTLLIIREKL